MMGHGLTSLPLKAGQEDLAARTGSPRLGEGEGGGEHLWTHVRTVNGGRHYQSSDNNLLARHLAFPKKGFGPVPKEKWIRR